MSFQPIAQAIVSNTGNVLLCGGIVLIAVALYFAYLLPRTRRTKRELVDAVRRLEDIPDDIALAREFEEFNVFAQDHPLLGHAWREFTETLLPPSEASRPPVFRNSHESSQYFNLETVLEGRLNTRLIGAVPGYMTGLGILGTFIGLVAGIFLASKGMDAGDIQKMRGSLQPLLSGAALAFWTSICGLICSLLFSVGEKRQFHAIEQTINRWNDALDRRLRRVTPEQLVAEQVAEATKQTLQLERFNTDLAVSIAQALDRQLSQSFSPRLDQMVTGIGDLKSHQATFSQDLMTRVSSEISRSVSGAAGTEMAAVAETLRSLVAVLQQSAGALSQGHGEMASAVDSIIQRMQTAFGDSSAHMNQEMGRAIEKMVTYLDAAGGAAAGQLRNASQDAATALSGAADRMTTSFEVASSGAAERLTVAAKDVAALFVQSSGSIQQSFGQYERTLERVQGVLQASGDAQASLRGVVQALQETHGAFRASVLPLQQAINRLGDVEQGMGAQLQNTRDLAQSLTGTAQEMKTSLVTLQQAWASHERRFEDVDRSAEKFFGQIREGVDAYTASIKGFVGQLDAQFAKALGELSSVVNELETTVDGLEQVMRNQVALR